MMEVDQQLAGLQTGHAPDDSFSVPDTSFSLPNTSFSLVDTPSSLVDTSSTSSTKEVEDTPLGSTSADSDTILAVDQQPDSIPAKTPLDTNQELQEENEKPDEDIVSLI